MKSLKTFLIVFSIVLAFVTMTFGPLVAIAYVESRSEVEAYEYKRAFDAAEALPQLRGPLLEALDDDCLSNAEWEVIEAERDRAEVTTAIDAFRQQNRHRIYVNGRWYVPEGQ